MLRTLEAVRNELKMDADTLRHRRVHEEHTKEMLEQNRESLGLLTRITAALEELAKQPIS